jgi:hypothetical protein
MQKYIINFYVDNNTLAALSSTQNEVYRFQLKVEQQQLTLMNCVTPLKQYIKIDYIYKVLKNHNK